jgi:hypothetical protein
MPRLVTQVAPRRKGDYAFDEIRETGCFMGPVADMVGIRIDML